MAIPRATIRDDVRAPVMKAPKAEPERIVCSSSTRPVLSQQKLLDAAVPPAHVNPLDGH